MASVAESPNRLFWLIVLALFLPFVSTGIEFGFCSQEFWLNLILTLLIPFCGFIHAVYVLVHARYSRAPSRSGYEPVPDVADVEQGAHPAQPAQPAVQRAQSAQPTFAPARTPGGAAQPAVSPATSPRTTPASSSKNPSATDAASQPPPYTPGHVAVPFDNKVQRG